MTDFIYLQKIYDLLHPGSVYMDDDNNLWLKPEQNDAYHLIDCLINISNGEICHFSKVMTNTCAKNEKKFVIYGESDGFKEVFETTTSRNEALFLASKYAMSFGSEWDIWFEEVK
jgi:hypothetical protein